MKKFSDDIRRMGTPVGLFFSAILVVFVQPLSSRTLYCSPDGNDDNPGTRSLPLRTPGFASRQLAAGDTLILLGGKYVISRFDDDILAPPDGRPDAWVTVLGEPGNRPILAGRDDLFSAVFLSSYLRMENIEITSDSGEPFRDGLNGTAGPLKRVELRDLHVHHIDEMALDVKDADSLSVVDCDFSFCGFGGIGGPAAEQGGIRHLLVSGCSLSYGGHYYRGVIDNPDNPYDRPDGFGIEHSDGPVEIERTVAAHNRGDGIDSKSSNTFVHECIAANNFGDGIKLWAGDSRIENSLVYGTGDGDPASGWAGIVIGDDWTPHSLYEIVNCTVHDNPERQGYAFYAQYEGDSNPIRLVVRNTIFSDCHGPVYVGDSVDLTCEYNLFDVPNDEVRITAGGREYTSDDFRNGLPGPGNRVGDPLFMRPAWGADGDYHLRPESPAIDNGTPIEGLTHDLDGNVRPQESAFDIGCYEYGNSTRVEGGGISVPAGPVLGQNFPNPFNPATTVTFDLPSASEVRLALFDVSGRLIRVLLQGRLAAGIHEIRVDATGLSSGAYLCRLEAQGVRKTVRLILQK